VRWKRRGCGTISSAAEGKQPQHLPVQVAVLKGLWRQGHVPRRDVDLAGPGGGGVLGGQGVWGECVVKWAQGRVQITSHHSGVLHMTDEQSVGAHL